MSDERMWFYMDSTGQEFGPYPSGTMKSWFQQGFFPMQGELQVRLDDMAPDQHHLIKDLFPEPIMERAFDGEPCLPRPKQAEGGGRRGGGGGGGGGGGRKQMQAQAPVAPQLPYDGGLGAAALWGMPGMMGAMQAPGMAPFGFPPRPGMPGMGMPGMMPGMPGGLGGMPMMPGMPGVGQSTGRFQGLIKSFNVQKGFGFIDCPEAHQIYGRDVFLHKAQIASFQIGSQVSFAVEINKTNMPQARDLVESDMLSMGMLGMPGVGMMPTGKGGYNNKGGNKGKGRGKNTNQKPKGAGGDKKPGDKKPNGGNGGSPGGSQPQAAAPALVSVPEGAGDAA